MNIGLIAHDAKKTLLQNLCIAYRSVLAKHTLYATGTSGRLQQRHRPPSMQKAFGAQMQLRYFHRAGDPVLSHRRVADAEGLHQRSGADGVHPG